MSRDLEGRIAALEGARSRQEEGAIVSPFPHGDPRNALPRLELAAAIGQWTPPSIEQWERNCLTGKYGDQ